MDRHRNCYQEMRSAGNSTCPKSRYLVHLLGLGLCAICSSFSLAAVVSAQAPPNAVVFAKDITIDDLQSGIDKRILPGASKTEVHTMLLHQPSVVLDGATLTLTPPKVGSSRSIAVNNLELRNGAKIVTGGIDLEIDALLISSDMVKSFRLTNL